MTDTASPQAAAPDDHDRLTRFMIETAGVRGVRVHLHDTWRQIRERAEYPAAAAEMLGEAAAAAALFTGHAKVDGRLSVQLRGEGALRTLFAECTAAGTLRGIVQLAEDGGEVSRDLRELGPQAVLAITIENPALNGRDPVRYQGLVSLESDTLAGAFEDYFRQSEQLPTRLLLAADDRHAAGLMLQKLPGDEGDDDGWARVGALFDTLNTRELLELPTGTLLTRLFHEDGVQLLGGKPLGFACSCSRERVEAMLVSLGREEADAAAADGQAHIRCEFCGQSYRFDRNQIAGLFAAAAAEIQAPQRVQ
ncbi:MULTISPECIES: Hsp33 family molecular chaperone HslO [unclassified Lysobacter]|uniref:Hsp33 family molecular chaperone HslO n=1 Tax=unclassified Lysobacter TaxID=2635362 RepID=UPI001BEAF2FC|nr:MULTISPECIES: Hsp33 family molecular chaperone HslO [unclassified Lysobacter]MBT2746460.1 Hsp33 family molecular chaperone HslO [Lysobacter sp. ISL-42]MBT2753183.1 Hsp33 family molecular chaperone HslO [Lysobacter sp. ISL-50]MBT2776642.1 Hsp33 family molecular chaperone HslO [Lysobacter sp. ISL-54]MBT2783359.1 Hsp33 family molecular chaperone HslO [Lysobacter sp. ISL-52]